MVSVRNVSIRHRSGTQLAPDDPTRMNISAVPTVQETERPNCPKTGTNFYARFTQHVVYGVSTYHHQHIRQCSCQEEFH